MSDLHEKPCGVFLISGEEEVRRQKRLSPRHGRDDDVR
jgi:hypothetical protein